MKTPRLTRRRGMLGPTLPPAAWERLPPAVIPRAQHGLFGGHNDPADGFNSGVCKQAMRPFPGNETFQPLQRSEPFMIQFPTRAPDPHQP